MVYVNDTPVGVAVQTPPIVAELQALFDRLPDTELLEALEGPTRRGPKGHPVQTLWCCFILKHHLALPSTAAMIRTLHQNPYIAAACGIPSPDAIPHEATFSRFFGKLAKRKYLHLVKDVSRNLVRQHYAELPGFGKRVAIDSTTIKAWSNGGKNPKADPNAGWSVKKNTHGKTTYTYGYKVHLLVDCEYELPIAANVSAGNVHDSQRASHLLAEARFTYGRFKPTHVIADTGYSGAPLAKLIKEQYWSTPIIDINPGHKRLAAKMRETLDTAEWKAIYRQRSAVERVNSRLKQGHSLNHVTTRRWMKVTVHCYLALIAMQALTGSLSLRGQQVHIQP